MCYQTTTLIKIFIHRVRDGIRKFINQGKKENCRPIMNRKPRWLGNSDPNIKKESSDYSANVLQPPARTATHASRRLLSSKRGPLQRLIHSSAVVSIRPPSPLEQTRRFISLIYSPSTVYKPSITNIIHQLTLTL